MPFLKASCVFFILYILHDHRYYGMINVCVLRPLLNHDNLACYNKYISIMMGYFAWKFFTVSSIYLSIIAVRTCPFCD